MKNKIILLKSVALCAFFVASVQAETDTNNKARYIYSIESSSGNSGYIFGSTHLSISKYPLSLGKCTKNALNISESVILEGDLIKTREFLSTNPNRSLAMSEVISLLTDTEIASLHKIIFGIPENSINDQKLRSMDAYSGIYLNLASKISQLIRYEIGVSDYGVDLEVLMASRFLNKNISTLEAPSEQLAHLKKIPPAMHAKHISAVLAILNSSELRAQEAKATLDTFRALAEGDEKSLLSNNSMAAGDSGFMTKFADLRNPNQAEKIDALMRSKTTRFPVFIALGALHLAGERGVPALLASKGYTVKRLCMNETE